MTNEQLCLLLINYETHIRHEIDRLEDDLPKSMRVMRQPIIGPSYEEIPALDGIRDFADSLSLQIDELRGGNQE